MIVALAFFAQSMIPVGFMPKLHSSELFEITICHGNDAIQILVDERMKPVTAEGSSHSNQDQSGDGSKPCPYSILSSKALNIEAFVYLSALELIYERAVERKTSSLVSFFIALPYEGRGPPQSLA